MDEPIKKKVFTEPDDVWLGEIAYPPIHAEEAETRAEAREAATRAEAAKAAAWGNARTETVKAVARAEEAAIRAEGATARTETVVRQKMTAESLLSPQDVRRARLVPRLWSDAMQQMPTTGIPRFLHCLSGCVHLSEYIQVW